MGEQAKVVICLRGSRSKTKEMGEGGHGKGSGGMEGVKRLPRAPGREELIPPGQF